MIDKDILRLARMLLKLASDEFANHGCNDFNLSEAVGKKRALEIVRQFHEWNGDPEEFDEAEGPNQLGNDILMSFIGDLLIGRTKFRGDD